MNRNVVKTHRYKVGKNTLIIINIFQSAKANAKNGNAFASNLANVRISAKKQLSNRKI